MPVAGMIYRNDVFFFFFSLLTRSFSLPPLCRAPPPGLVSSGASILFLRAQRRAMAIGGTVPAVVCSDLALVTASRPHPPSTKRKCRGTDAVPALSVRDRRIFGLRRDVPR